MKFLINLVAILYGKDIWQMKMRAQMLLVGTQKSCCLFPPMLILRGLTLGITKRTSYLYTPLELLDPGCSTMNVHMVQ